MALYAFKLPDIGEGIAEAEIVGWHVAVGDLVREDDPLADMMTDKATVEMSAPVSGKVLRIAGEIGERIAIGSVLVELEIEAGGDEAHSASPISAPAPIPAAAPSPSHPPAEVVAPAEALVPIAAEKIVIDAREEKTPPVVSGPALDLPEKPASKVLASPAVRRRAAELGINLVEVAARSGDRLRHNDLDAFLSYNARYQPVGTCRPDEQVRVIGLRRRIAENMSAAKRHIPHFSYVEEIDVTKFEAMRQDLNTQRGERPKLTMLPLLIVAICKAVVDYPMINARYDDEAGIVTRCGAVHMGIATQTKGGLMVPVLRNAQDRNIWQLAAELQRLAEAARAGTASAAELSGSTLTITSLGTLGGIATTPVINRPEVAIIGPNRLVERPIVRDGAIIVAKMMNLSISCDHRVVDGWDAASFVQRVKHLIETPAFLLID